MASKWSDWLARSVCCADAAELLTGGDSFHK